MIYQPPSTPEAYLRLSPAGSLTRTSLMTTESSSTVSLGAGEGGGEARERPERGWGGWEGGGKEEAIYLDYVLLTCICFHQPYCQQTQKFS